MGLLLLAALRLEVSARGQAIGFVPIPAPFPNGTILNVTPAVSADRRYVRLTMNPTFNVLNGFTTISVPAAVSGGGAGMNGLLGGLGGAGGGGGMVRPAAWAEEPREAESVPSGWVRRPWRQGRRGLLLVHRPVIHSSRQDEVQKERPCRYLRHHRWSKSRGLELAIHNQALGDLISGGDLGRAIRSKHASSLRDRFQPPARKCRQSSISTIFPLIPER